MDMEGDTASLRNLQDNERTRRYVIGISLTSLVSAVALAVVSVMLIEESTRPTRPTPAPSDPTFPCDVDCVKKEAGFQGADLLTSLDSLKFSMDVQYSAAEDAGEACGDNHTFPAFEGLALNPKLQLKLTTVDTRETPSVTFECEGGKYYHLVLSDSLGGPFQIARAYTHWVRLNMFCPADQSWAMAVDSGVDMKQGASVVPGWFEGFGYLPPAFPYNTFHHFNFFLFETDVAFDDTRLLRFNTEFPGNNVLGNAFNIEQIMADLELQGPVARTWMDVTTSYWSQVRMGRIEDYVKDQEFYQLICPCNQASSWPGLNQSGDVACNV